MPANSHRSQQSFRFSKKLRLLNERDFERVFKARTSATALGFVLYGVANELEHPRLGLAVSRKVGGAPARNRWKRLLREAFRLAQHELPAFDFVCVPRSPEPPSVGELGAAVIDLAERIRRRQEVPGGGACRSSRHEKTHPTSSEP